MAETSKTYIVNYEINANGAGAIGAFNALIEPVAKLQEQFASIRSSFEGVQTAVAATQKSLQQLSFKPTIELTPFKDALAAMELNAAKTAARIRSIMETSLGGSRAQFDQRMAGVGKGGWIDVKSADTNAVKENAHYSRLLRALQYRATILKKIREANSKETFQSFAESKGLSKSQMDALRRGLKISIPIYEPDGRRINNKTAVLDPTRGHLKELLEKERGGNTDAKLRDLHRRMRWQSKWLRRNYGEGNTHIHSAVSEANAFLKERGYEGFIFDRGTGEITSKLGNSGNAYLNQLDTQLKQSRSMVRAANKKMAEIRATSLQGTAASPTGDFSGLVTAMNPTGINTMAEGIQTTIASLKQMPKNGFPLTVKATMTGVAEMSTKLVEMLTSLQTKANSKPIKIKSTIQPPSQADLNKTIKSLVGTKKKPGVAAGANIPFTISGLDAMSAKLTETIAALQEIASSKVISIKARLNKPTKTSVEEMKALGQITGGDRTVNITANILGNFHEKLAMFKDFMLLYKDLKGGTKSLVLDAKLALSGITESAMGKLKLFATAYKDFKAGKKEAVLTAKINPPTQAEFDKINKFKSGKSKGMKKNVMIDVAFSANQAQAALSKLKNLTLNAVIKPVWGGIKNKANEMKAIESKIPPIKIRLDISQAKATLNELIANIKAVSNQTIKLSTTASRTINNASSTLLNTATRVRRANAPPSYTRSLVLPPPTPASKGRNWNRILYPLTGNTSLGATTPAAISMAKGFGVMYAVGGAMSGISSAMSQSVDYQNTMETASAILGRNYNGSNFERDFVNMERIARKVGMDTKYTAPDVANATRFMAMAGLDIPMITHSLRPIADVSLIGDNDLGEVADKMTNIQTGFNLRGNQMRNLADQMTNTFTQTNTDMMMIAESMQYAAPMAHLAGAKVGDTLALLGVMGNAGIQASMAGTTLRMMYQNVINPNKKQRALWDELGVQRMDASGKPRNMIDILSDIANNKKVNENNLAQVVSGLFRVTASAGAGQLISDLRKGDNSLVRKIAEQNKGYDINGLSQELAEKKQNTVQGLWAQVTSAFTEDNLQMFEEFQGFIKDVLTSLRDFMRSKEAIDSLRSVLNIIKDIVDVMGYVASFWIDLFQGWTGKVAKFFIVAQFAMQQFGALLAPIKGVINVLSGLKEAIFGVSAAGAASGFMRGGASVSSMAGGVAASFGTANAISKIQTNPAVATAIPAAQIASFNKGRSYPISYAPWAMVLPRTNTPTAKMLSAATVSTASLDATIASLQSGPRKKLNKVQQAALDRAIAVRAGLVSSEQVARAQGIEKAWQLRRVQQLNNMALMNRYIQMGGTGFGVPERFAMIRDERRKARAAGWMTVQQQLANQQDIAKAQRLQSLREASAARRMSQLQNEAIVRRYQRMYGANMATDAAMAFGIYRQAAYNRNAPLKTLRRPAQLQNATLLARGGWKFQKAGFANAFNTGLTALSISNLWGSIKTGFTSVVMGLSKGLAMLMSPVSLLGTTLVALVGSIAYAVIQQRKNNEKLRNAVKEDAPERNKMASAANANGGNYFKQIDTEEIAKNNLIKGSKESDKKFKDIPGFSSIYTDGSDSESYRRTVWSQYILPLVNSGVSGYNNLTYNKWRESQNAKVTAKTVGMTDMNAVAYWTKRYGTQFAREDAERAAVISKTFQMPGFIRAKEQARNIWKEWSELDAKDRGSRKGEYQQRILALRAPFARYATAPSISNIKGGLQNATLAKVAETKESMSAAYNAITQMANDPENKWTGYYQQIAEWGDNIKVLSAQWGQRMGKLVNLFPLTAKDSMGMVQQFYLKTKKDGTIDWENTMQSLKIWGLEVKGGIKNHLQWIAQIYSQIRNDAAGASKLAGLSAGDFAIAMTGVKPGDKFSLKDWKDIVISYWEGHQDYTAPGNRKFKSGEEFFNWKGWRNAARMNKMAKWYVDTINGTMAPSKPSNPNNATGNGTGGVTKPLGNINDGYENNYDRHTGRPTQIVINIDKLANFDKSQFLTADQQKMAMMVQDSVSQGLMQLIPQINYALGAINTNSGN